MAPTRSVTTDNSNHELIPPPDLKYELAAVSAAILDKEDQRGEFTRRANAEIKKLKKRQRELVSEIKAGGTQLEMHYAAEKVAEVTTGKGEGLDDDHEGDDDDN
jgi:hypothetical protein